MNEICLADLPDGLRLEVETGHHTYSLIKSEHQSRVWISGHPEYCPAPIEVQMFGRARNGGIRPGVIAPGLRMQFLHPAHRQVSTSEVRAVRYV